MQSHEMVLPKMSKKTVWISCYFSHYNAIVIFSEKPFITMDGEGWDNNVKGDYYDLIDERNKHIIAGVCTLGEFKKLFPTVNLSPLIQPNGNVVSVEPRVLIKTTITAMWDNCKLKNIDFSLDGYQHR